MKDQRRSAHALANHRILHLFLDPIPGELFYGNWPDKNSRGLTELLVERVSRHPPIIAYVIENKSEGLRVVGQNAQKTGFSAGSVIVKRIGHAVLTVSLPSGTEEEYRITLPRLRRDGLWYGSPTSTAADPSR